MAHRGLDRREVVHELGHELGIRYSTHGRQRAEAIVDTAAFIVCGSLGLDTTTRSVPMRGLD